MKRIGSGEMTDKQIRDFIGVVSKLQAQMIPVDSDGDSAVNIVIIDRRKYEPLHYLPVPYRHKDAEGYEQYIIANLKMAVEAADRMLKLKQIAASNLPRVGD